MKKLILILGVLFMTILASGQTKPTEVAPDSYITKPVYEYIFGTTADTMTNADTLEWVIRIKGSATQDFDIRVYNDFVSGTATGKFKTYLSPDGVNYQVTAAADSITVTTISADILDSEVITLDNYLKPYLKIIYHQAGTGVNVPRAYIYSKEN